MSDEKLTKKQRRLFKRDQKQQKAEAKLKRSKQKKILQWIGAIGVLLGIVFIIVFATSPSSGTRSDLSEPVNDMDITRGNPSASLVLIEYSDFQCPACNYYHTITKQLMDNFPNEMLFVYRHFPLKSIHQNAELASKASQAAHVQGKFFEMHDLVFENQSVWAQQDNATAEETFTTYASKLGMDLDQFKQDMLSRDVQSKINKDYKGALASNVNSTPTFFLNGKKLTKNPQSYEEFADLIRKEATE